MIKNLRPPSTQSFMARTSVFIEASTNEKLVPVSNSTLLKNPANNMTEPMPEHGLRPLRRVGDIYGNYIVKTELKAVPVSNRTLLQAKRSNPITGTFIMRKNEPMPVPTNLSKEYRKLLNLNVLPAGYALNKGPKKIELAFLEKLTNDNAKRVVLEFMKNSLAGSVYKPLRIYFGKTEDGGIEKNSQAKEAYDSALQEMLELYQRGITQGASVDLVLAKFMGELRRIYNTSEFNIDNYVSDKKGIEDSIKDLMAYGYEQQQLDEANREDPNGVAPKSTTDAILQNILIAIQTGGLPNKDAIGKIVNAEEKLGSGTSDSASDVFADPLAQEQLANAVGTLNEDNASSETSEAYNKNKDPRYAEVYGSDPKDPKTAMERSILTLLADKKRVALLRSRAGELFTRPLNEISLLTPPLPSSSYSLSDPDLTSTSSGSSRTTGALLPSSSYSLSDPDLTSTSSGSSRIAPSVGSQSVFLLPPTEAGPEVTETIVPLLDLSNVKLKFSELNNVDVLNDTISKLSDKPADALVKAISTNELLSYARLLQETVSSKEAAGQDASSEARASNKLNKELQIRLENDLATKNASDIPYTDISSSTAVNLHLYPKTTTTGTSQQVHLHEYSKSSETSAKAPKAASDKAPKAASDKAPKTASQKVESESEQKVKSDQAPAEAISYESQPKNEKLETMKIKFATDPTYNSTYKRLVEKIDSNIPIKTKLPLYDINYVTKAIEIEEPETKLKELNKIKRAMIKTLQFNEKYKYDNRFVKSLTQPIDEFKEGQEIGIIISKTIKHITRYQDAAEQHNLKVDAEMKKKQSSGQGRKSRKSKKQALPKLEVTDEEYKKSTKKLLKREKSKKAFQELLEQQPIKRGATRFSTDELNQIINSILSSPL